MVKKINKELIKSAEMDDKEDQKMRLKVSEEDEDEMKKATEDEEEEDCDICKKPMSECECKKKGSEGGENPAEGSASGTDANSSTSPNMGVPSSQQVMHNNSGINVGRDASSGSSLGQSPSEVNYMGKSTNLDLMKSPMFVELSSQLTNLQKSFEKKLEALEKSANDRIVNVLKHIEKIEEFYSQPMYKSADMSTQKNTPVEKSFADKVDAGVFERR